MNRISLLISLTFTISLLSARADETMLPDVVHTTEAKARSLSVKKVDLKTKPVLKTAQESQQEIKLPQQPAIRHQDPNGLNVLYGNGVPVQSPEAPKPSYSPSEVGDFDAPKVHDFRPDTTKENEPKIAVPSSVRGHLLKNEQRSSQ